MAAEFVLILIKKRLFRGWIVHPVPPLSYGPTLSSSLGRG